MPSSLNLWKYMCIIQEDARSSFSVKKWYHLEMNVTIEHFEHFGTLFNFSIIFFASLCLAYYFFNILLFLSIQIQKFSSLASLGILLLN